MNVVGTSANKDEDNSSLTDTQKRGTRPSRSDTLLL